MVDDQRILSMVKKNPFTTSSQVKKTLQESLQEKTSREQIQRVHHKVQTRPDSSLPKKSPKKPDHFWKSIIWTAEIKIKLYQNDRKKKVWRRLGTAHDPKQITSSVKHGAAV